MIFAKPCVTCFGKGIASIYKETKEGGTIEVGECGICEGRGWVWTAIPEGNDPLEVVTTAMQMPKYNLKLKDDIS